MVAGANFDRAEVASAKLVGLVGEDAAVNLDRANNLDRAVRE
jgi:hypothetical protein